MKKIVSFLVLGIIIIFGQTGKVTVDSENFRASPNGAKIGVLLKGTEFSKIRSEGKWVKVTVEGWIYEPSTTFNKGTVTRRTPQTKSDDQKYSNLGFEVISFHSKWEGDRLRVIGEIKNITNSAKGVQVEAIARDSNGNLIDSEKFWPASINNIPPGQTTGIGHTVTDDKRATQVELKIISTEVW